MKLKDLLKESKVWERKFGDSLPTLEDVQNKYDKKLNETLPAYPKEWKNLEKACYDLEKAVTILAKSVARQDKTKGKTIANTYKTLQKSIKGYKEMLKNNILSKLQ